VIGKPKLNAETRRKALKTRRKEEGKEVKVTASPWNVPSFCNENRPAQKHDYVVTVLQTPSLITVSNP
jgi:O-glycosyl hydrolase